MTNDEQNKKDFSESGEDDLDIEFEADENELGSDLTLKLNRLKAELKACRKDKQEYLDGWQRSRAEVVNLKKEKDDQAKKIGQLTKERTVLEFLPVIDSFDMAFADKEAWQKVDENWRKGVEYIYDQLFKALESSGVNVIKDVEEFDPNLHEPIEMVETKKKTDDGKIKEVAQRGYQINDRVVRPAKVKIFKYKG